MEAKSISDSKRLVRAWNWQFARKALRNRDVAHSKSWKLLTVAGPAPQEEISCIRDVMPNAHITSVDINPKNVDAAISAGADVGVCLNLRDFSIAGDSLGRRLPHEELLGQKFDAMFFDMTESADKVADLIAVYWGHLAPGGMMMATMSYGRDVVEHMDWYWDMAAAEPTASYELISGIDMPRKIKTRVFRACGKLGKNLYSVLQYQGKVMPMINVMLAKPKHNIKMLNGFGYAKIEEDDFEKAVSIETPEDHAHIIYASPKERIIYASPKERIEAIRQSAKRRDAAFKAADTRRAKKADELSKLFDATKAQRKLDEMVHKPVVFGRTCAVCGGCDEDVMPYRIEPDGSLTPLFDEAT